MLSLAKGWSSKKVTVNLDWIKIKLSDQKLAPLLFLGP